MTEAMEVEPPTRVILSAAKEMHEVTAIAATIPSVVIVFFIRLFLLGVWLYVEFSISVLK